MRLARLAITQNAQMEVASGFSARLSASPGKAPKQAVYEMPVRLELDANGRDGPSLLFPPVPVICWCP
jgi:hypothetical protein